MTLPNFLYVGMSKAASTYIYEMLRQHPEVYVPVLKDIFFFDREWRRGVEWYKKHFDGADSSGAIGEVSHDYWLSEETCRRIQSTVPDIKIIVCLREPLDWLVSKYIFENGRKILACTDIKTFFDSPNIQNELRYAQNVNRLFKFFGRSNVKLLFYDNLCGDPGGFCRELYDFIGVDASFLPDNYKRRVLVSHSPRIKFIVCIVQSTINMMRALGAHRLLGRLKRSKLMHGLFFTENVSKPFINEGVAQHVVSSMQTEIHALNKLVGGVPDNWKRIYTVS